MEPLKTAEPDISRGSCKFCGSDDLYNRSVYAENSSIMVFVICRECGRSWALPYIKNDRKRTNTTLQHWAAQVKKRDGFRCVICGRTEHLEAHHLIPVRVDAELKYSVQNGITLCRDCHARVEGRKE